MCRVSAGGPSDETPAPGIQIEVHINLRPPHVRVRGIVFQLLPPPSASPHHQLATPRALQMNVLAHRALVARLHASQLGRNRSALRTTVTG